MRRATLIVNPNAGLRRDLPKLLAAMTGILNRKGIEAGWILTTAPGTAGRLSEEAIAAGSDTIFACGGDGTVHEVLQGIVGTPASLGVIPIGTANALARNLGLSSDPLAPSPGSWMPRVKESRSERWRAIQLRIRRQVNLGPLRTYCDLATSR